MERSLQAAVDSLQTSIDDLNSLFSPEVAAASGSLEHGGRPKLTNDTPITLHAVTPFPQILQTSLGREVNLNSLPCVCSSTTDKTPFPSVL